METPLLFRPFYMFMYSTVGITTTYCQRCFKRQLQFRVSYTFRCKLKKKCLHYCLTTISVPIFTTTTETTGLVDLINWQLLCCGSIPGYACTIEIDNEYVTTSPYPMRAFAFDRSRPVRGGWLKCLRGPINFTVSRRCAVSHRWLVAGARPWALCAIDTVDATTDAVLCTAH